MARAINETGSGDRVATGSLQGSRELATNSNTQATQVVARQVDSYVAPTHDWEMEGLVNGLASINPALNQYAFQTQKKTNDDQELAGRKARLEQKDNVVALPPEASPAFQRGYKGLHGEILAAELNRTMDAAFEDHKNDPDFDAASFVQQSVTEHGNGIDDPDMLRTYLPNASAISEHYRTKYASHQLDVIREQRDTNLGTLARTMVEDTASTGGITPEWIGKFQDQGLSLDRTRSESTAILLQAVDAAAEQGYPELYDSFLKTDANGVAPVDNPKLSAKIYDGIAKATRVRDQRLKEATAHSDLAVWTETKARLEGEESGMVNEIFNNPNLNETDKRTFISAALTVDRKVQIKGIALTDILGGSARFATLPAEHQGVYQGTFDTYGQQLLNNASNDPAQRSQALGQIITLGTKNGMVFTPMKKLLSTVNTDVSTTPGEVPASVTQAADFYMELKKVNPAVALGYTTDGSRSFLDVYTHLRSSGSNDKQAYAAAVRLSDPETRKANQEFMSSNRVAITKSIDSELGKVEGTDAFLGFGKDKTKNIDSIKSFVRADMESNPASATLGVEEATKVALDKFKATHVNDGNGRYLYVGLGGADEKFAGAVKMQLDAIKEQHLAATGQPSVDLHFQPVPGGGDTYQVWGVLGPEPGPLYSRADMLDKYRDSTAKLSAQQAQEKPNLNAFANKVHTSKASSPELMTEIEANDAKVQDLWRSGGMSNKDYARYEAGKGLMKLDSWGKKLTERNTLTDSPLYQGMNKDMSNVQLSQPSRNPVSGANSVELARRYASSDPAFATTVMVEGLSLGLYPDPAGGRAIGVGYNIDKQGEPKARKDLKAAGVPDLVVDKLLSTDPKQSGSVALSPDQAVRLYKKVQPEFEAIAKKPMGADWDKLGDNQKAALTYLAYNTGSAYPKALAAIQKGDLEGAAKEMTIHYKDEKTGNMVQNTRAMEIVRSMFVSPNRFMAVVDHVGRGGKSSIQPTQVAEALKPFGL